MNGDLRHWQQRLAEHFRELASQRSRSSERAPVFALEHGLETTEIQALESAVRAHIAHTAPLIDHALPWIVYAAELGYGYSGDEYWQTFEGQTPGWTIRGDRYWIRERYLKFQTIYGGAKPSGAWASHFTIICWPITHAILPRDLQRQLASILYELRHYFSADLFESPSKLGELIAARSWNGSSRFQNFVQETHLVGQIATALLLEGQTGTSSLIHPATLRRIGTDLDRERRAREWLRGAKHVAQERARIRGIVQGHGALSSLVHRLDEARAEVSALGIEPRLVLRPKAQSGSCWELMLEIPDLSHLPLRFPNTRDVLAGSRCSVAGALGRPLARGRCLHGAQRVTLSRLPHWDEVLLQFEQKDAQLEYLLRTECLLRPGSCWLFRIASDGLAYESRTLRVRPGERYIFVTSVGPIAAIDNLRSIELDCVGVYGALLELPGVLTSDWEETLRRLGLGHAKSIEVWPAGLGAVLWDGDGHGEWLVTEHPCFAIRTDHPVAALFVSMGTHPDISLELKTAEPGKPIFVELPKLSIGLHTLRISTRTGTSSEAESNGELNVVMRVRAARPWSPGTSHHGALVVQIDPAAPRLEQLWEGRIEITVRGPSGRRIKCTVLLRETASGAAIVTKQLPPITLPMTPEMWRHHFKKHFAEKQDLQLAYDNARSCEVEFKNEELGTYTFHCERDFTPLRWAVRRHGHNYRLRLLNDIGDNHQPEMTYSAYETPCVEETFTCNSEIAVPESGGLYIARGDRATAAVVVPPVIKTFADFKCAPQIHGYTRSYDSIFKLLRVICLWEQAKVTGDIFSSTRRRNVILSLLHYIFRLMCGENWADAEKTNDGGELNISRLEYSITQKGYEKAIVVVLARKIDDLLDKSCYERVKWMANLTSRYGYFLHKEDKDGDPEWFCEFALRLSSDPSNVETWAGERIREGLDRLLREPTLTRVARFMVIATDVRLDSKITPEELYASWGWR